MVEIRKANVNDTDFVTDMVVSLLIELVGKPYEKKEYEEVTKQLLVSPNLYTVFVATVNSSEYIGLISVTESHSIYAGGKFGIIQELYVKPGYRSKNIGKELIRTVIEYGESNNWTRLEVGAPNADQWDRTISFYKREGFREIGPRLSFKLQE